MASNIYDGCGDAATLPRFSRPWPATGERFGIVQALRCPTFPSLGPSLEIQTGQAVSGAELEKEARKQRGTAASIDGWSEADVASFSSVVWDSIAMLFQRL